MPINDTRGLWRGKTMPKYNGEEFNEVWVEGDLIHSENRYYIHPVANAVKVQNELGKLIIMHEVDPSTLGKCTGLRDKNGKLIFEGDIVQYNAFYYFSCKSVVKISNYKQDGSDGEYEPTECYGMFVEVDSFACPDWGENEFNLFPEYLMQQNLLEVASECEIIGNIHDNPNLLKGAEINGSRS